MSPVHGWSDDGCAYLYHSLNLLEGRPYGEAPYGVTPASKSPAAVYPPLLPLLLAPVVGAWGLNFIAFKALMLALFLGALAACWVLLRPVLTAWEGLAVAAVMGINYHLWLVADHINSDYLFLLVLALSFVWLSASQNAPEHQWPWRSLAAGTLLLLAAATRSVGMVLPGVLLLYSLWRYRRLKALYLASAAWAVVFMAILFHYSQAGKGYDRQLLNLFSWTTLRRNLIQYPLALGGLFEGGPVISALAGGWMLYGAYRIGRQSRELWLVFAGVYLGVITVWPFSEPERFLIPVWPLAIACLVRGLTSAARRLPTTAATAALAAVFLLMLGPQVRLHAQGPLRAELNSSDPMELYAAIRSQTLPEDVLLFRKPRAVALFTRRRSLSYAPLARSADFGRDVCAAGVTHLISAPEIFPDDAQYLAPFVEAYRGQVDRLFQNRHYTLYRLHPGACAVIMGARAGLGPPGSQRRS